MGQWKPTDKDWKPLIAATEAAGFIQVRASGPHVVYAHPKGGSRITFPKSASDHRSLRNARAMLRRVGVELPTNRKRSKPTMRGQLIENYNIAAAQAGVPSVSALHVLAAVATMPEGVPFDSSRLAVTTDYHKASTGTALRWMVEKGYARKRPERGRNGVLRYELTEDGGALIELLKLRPEPAPPEPEPARIAYPDPDPDPALESAVDQALAAIVPIDPPDTDALAASIATLVATVKALERSVATRSGIVLTLELPRVVYVAVAGGPDRISSASEVSSEHIRALNCLVGAVKGAE